VQVVYIRLPVMSLNAVSCLIAFEFVILNARLSPRTMHLPNTNVNTSKSSPIYCCETSGPAATDRHRDI
jgi:hypothetical protein